MCREQVNPKLDRSDRRTQIAFGAALSRQNAKYKMASRLISLGVSHELALKNPTEK